MKRLSCVAPGLQCLPSKCAHRKGCLEELDECTPKLVRLDNENEGTPYHTLVRIK